MIPQISNRYIVMVSLSLNNSSLSNTIPEHDMAGVSGGVILPEVLVSEIFTTEMNTHISNRQTFD